MKINLIYKVKNNLFTLKFYFIFNSNFRSTKFLFVLLIFIMFL